MFLLIPGVIKQHKTETDISIYNEHSTLELRLIVNSFCILCLGLDVFVYFCSGVMIYQLPFICFIYKSKIVIILLL